MKSLYRLLTYSFLLLGWYCSYAQTADLELHLQANPPTYLPNEEIEFTLYVVHTAGENTNTEVSFSLPDSTSLLGLRSNNGSYLPHIGTWRIYDLAVNDTAYLKINAYNFNKSGPIEAFAQITKSDLLDPDSTPNNNSTLAAVEDDEGSLTILALQEDIPTRLEFFEFPSDEQLFPRKTQDNSGTIRIHGMATEGQQYTDLLVKLYREDTFQQSYRTSLGYENTTAEFEFTIPILAELANYKIELYGVNVHGEETLEACASNLVAGDVYLINGQSNAQANVAPHPSDNHPFARAYDFGLDWTNMQYSSPGQWGARIAIETIMKQDIPVAVFNQAVGGQRIDFYLKNETDPNEGNYGRLLRRLKAAGMEKQDIRAAFWFQGEGDGWTAGEAFIDTYKTKFKKIHTAWVDDYGIDKSYIFQIRYQSCLHLYPFVMEAQRELQDEIPNLSTMSTTNTAHDSCHYYYEEGYASLGNRGYALMASELYNATDYNVKAPNIRRAYLSDSTQITVELRDVQGELDVIGTPWHEFKIEGTNVDVISGTTEGERIILELSGVPIGATGVSYLSHIGSAPDWLTNDRGVGLLTFYNYPIEALPSYSADLEVNLHAPSNSYERFQIFAYKTTLFNNSSIAATNIELEVPIPAGTAFSSSEVDAGNYRSWEDKWTIPYLAPGDSLSLEINVFPLIDDETLVAYAQVIDVDQSDPDSSPANGTRSFPREDDEARLLFISGIEQTASEEVDIALTLTADLTNYTIYSPVTYHLVVENKKESEVTNLDVDLTLQEGFAYTSHQVSHGRYDNWNTEWHISTLAAGEKAELTFTMFTLTDTSDLLVYAVLESLDQLDVNAGNNTTEWVIYSRDDLAEDIYLSQNGNQSETTTRIIKGYPVPAQDIFYLQTFSEVKQATTLYINDTQGRLLKTFLYDLEEGTNTISVDCSALPQGVYFLGLRNSTTKDLFYKMMKN